MRVKGMAADGLLLPEEVQVGGPALILRLPEKSVDARKGGGVVVACELPHGSPVERRLLHGHNIRASCGLRVDSGRGVLPVTADEKGGKGNQRETSTAPRKHASSPHGPSLLTEEVNSRGCLERRCWKHPILVRAVTKIGCVAESIL